MIARDRGDIAEALAEVRGGSPPYRIQAGELGWVNRPRLYWLSWDLGDTSESIVRREGAISSVEFENLELPPLEWLLDEGAQWLGGKPDARFPTAERWIEHRQPPPDPAGLDACDFETLRRWEGGKFAVALCQFRKQNCVVGADGEARARNADERERLRGFWTGHTAGELEDNGVSYLGNSFRCVAIARVLSQWAMEQGYLSEMQIVSDVRQRSLSGEGSGAAAGSCYDSAAALVATAVGSCCDSAAALPANEAEIQGLASVGGSRPDRSEYPLGVLCKFGALGGYEFPETARGFVLGEVCLRMTGVLGRPDVTGEFDLEERTFRLIQADELASDILACEVPSDAYYEELRRLMSKRRLSMDGDLLDHLASVAIAFDIAACFSMSFGVAKFALAREEAKLAGGDLWETRP
jgi:hypothetical protein